MDIKRSKKVHIIVQEEPKRKAPRVPQPEPDTVNLFYKKLEARIIPDRDIRTSTTVDMETNYPRKEKELEPGLTFEKLKETFVKLSVGSGKDTITGRIIGPSPQQMEKSSFRYNLYNVPSFKLSSSDRLRKKEKEAKAEAQLENARNAPENYWITADGQRIYISNMSDKHLANTINWLLNRLNKEVATYISYKYRDLRDQYNIYQRATITANDFFLELKFLEKLEGCELAFKRYPKLRTLLAEAMGRGLNWEDYKQKRTKKNETLSNKKW